MSFLQLSSFSTSTSPVHYLIVTSANLWYEKFSYECQTCFVSLECVRRSVVVISFNLCLIIHTLSPGYPSVVWSQALRNNSLLDAKSNTLYNFHPLIVRAKHPSWYNVSVWNLPANKTSQTRDGDGHKPRRTDSNDTWWLVYAIQLLCAPRATSVERHTILLSSAAPYLTSLMRQSKMASWREVNG